MGSERSASHLMAVSSDAPKEVAIVKEHRSNDTSGGTGPVNETIVIDPTIPEFTNIVLPAAFAQCFFKDSILFTIVF